MANPNPPKVFISYSWDDNDAHKNWVLNFANDLTQNGVYVILDEYDNTVGRNITQFIDHALEDAEKVIVIFTEGYKKKAFDRSGYAGYEYQMINTLWRKLEQKENKVKVIPVLRSGSFEEDLPLFAQDFSVADMSDDANYDRMLEEVLRAIYGVARHRRPEIGQPPAFLNQTGNDQPTGNTSPTKSTGQDSISTPTLDPNAPLPQFKKQLLTALRQDFFPQVLDALDQYSHAHDDSDLQTFVVMKYANYNNLKREKKRGNLSYDQLQLQTNRLRSSLMDIVDDI